VIVATLVIAVALSAIESLPIPLPLLGATLFIAMIGLVDDIKTIPVVPRLLFQTLAIGAVLVTFPSALRIAPHWPIGLERGLLLIAGLWFVNLVNFMDGLDLMTVAEAVPITFTLSFLGWLGELSSLPTIVATALCGALLGFSPFNRPVAKVFLGDVGSLPIGLVLGWCLLQLAFEHQLAAALLLPLYYFADSTITLLRRIAKREAFWAAHRSHYYQLATDNGFTVKQIVGQVFALNCVLAALATATVALNSPLFNASALLAGTMAVAYLLLTLSRKRSD
jgi:UDP-N-acetylmuramyl pentapeptide phosphotransferase/UDP-N-acetylglucosamine-1-phosphate transferase